MRLNNLKIVIAGPGAGKTYSITNEVIKCLPSLDAHKFCAVVTYTNAATDEIKTRLTKEVNIRSNLFVGTIHSFLIHFIFEPFAHLLNISEVEKYYIDRVKVQNNKNKFAAKNWAINFSENLVNDGIVTYDQILNQAFIIIKKDENIKRIISHRLQYVFIDEYQDSRLIQHFLIKKLIELKKTSFFCIGDPLQSIYYFTYNQSQIKQEPTPKSFNETAMMDLQHLFKECVTSSTKNYRSSSNIVNIINHYIKLPENKQTSDFGDNEIPVYFITKSNKIEIINVYEQINTHYDLDTIHNNTCNRIGKTIKKKLVLSKKWELLSDVCNQRGLSELPKNNHKQYNHLHEVSRIILGILGLKKSEVLFFTKDELAFRKFCFHILRKIKSLSEDRIDPKFIIELFKQEFQCSLSLSNSATEITKSLEDLREKRFILGSTSFYSAIHSSKGLEATSVLVCAQTENELLKWLDSEKANTEKDDDYRLGYVAFSRARDILCVACLKPIKERKTFDMLGAMNFKLSDDIINDVENKFW